MDMTVFCENFGAGDGTSVDSAHAECVVFCSDIPVQWHASVVYAIVVSVRLSQVSILVKWLNIGSHKQRHTTAQGL